MNRFSSTRNILKSSVALGLVLLATRGFVGVKDVVLSRSFGTSSDLDAFLVAFGIMSFLASVISSAGMSTLVPALSRARNEPEPEAEARLVVVAAVAGCSLCSLVAIVAIAFRGPLSSWVAPGFGVDRAATVQQLLVDLAPVPVLVALQSIVASTLNSRYGFRGAAAITAITPVCVIAVLMLRHQPNARDLALGTILGMALEVVSLIVLARRHRILLWASVSWARAVRSVSSLARDFFPLIAGTALSSTSPLVDQAFASTVGPGAVSTLSYANRLIALAMGIGISSIGVIALPHFSDLAAREDWSEMRALLRKLAAATFALALPAALGIAIFSAPLIRLIFQHGHFVATDTSAVAPVQTLYALQIPFHLTGVVAVRALNAMRQNRTIMILVGWNVFSNVVGDYVFMKLFGLSGIALATSTTYMVSCVMVLIFASVELRKRAKMSPAKLPL